jgi:gliding motility-associated-like protein
MINVFSHPHANFTESPQPTTIQNPNIQFTDLTTDQYGIASWNWTFNDPSDSNAVSNLQNPAHTYSDTGTFCPTEIVVNLHGCTDTVTHCLIIDQQFSLYIPDAFTPLNSDGLNTIFTAKGKYIQNFEMYIFDRWGMQLFHTLSIDKGWDGRVNEGANVCQEDTYVYLINVTDNMNKKHSYIGKVVLIK